jgi:hypothetical protein
MTSTMSDEFLDMVALWMRRRGNRYADNWRYSSKESLQSVQRVLAVVQDEETTGGCHTCYETHAVLRITYIDDTGETHTVTRWVAYAQLIKDLEQLAQIEERRQPRLEMMRTMTAAIAEMPGRSDVVFEVLVGMDYPGPDGENVRSEAGDIVTYLPPTSTSWLIKEGHVRPLCTTGQSGEDCNCKWCRVAALTEEDREWLSLYGWANPFLKAVE